LTLPPELRSRPRRRHALQSPRFGASEKSDPLLFSAMIGLIGEHWLLLTVGWIG
jgi:hypothetical protein